MQRRSGHLAALAVLAAAAVAASLLAGQAAAGGQATAMAGKAKLTEAALRVKLDNLLGEHAVLAMNATNLGFSGAKAFSAAAAELDRNSVALSKVIASVYGAKAGRLFLNGKDMWRDHIKFFVDYTTALAKGDKAAEDAAVANLKAYTVTFGNFLAGATGLPKAAVRNDLLAHVLQLKGQLDAYAAGNYAKAATLYHEAYNHMFMTGDLLAAAIAKQKGLSPA